MNQHWSDLEKQCNCESKQQCGVCPLHGEFHSGINPFCGCGQSVCPFCYEQIQSKEHYCNYG